jgi:DNA-binding CsgD family transcriptional regulator
VRIRLSRESETVRKGVTKMALIQRAPLSVVVSALGHEVVAEMEQQGYLLVSQDGPLHTYLAEPYIGEAVRNWLTVEEKASLFREVSTVISPDPSALEMADLLRFASWANDSNVALEPEIALAAARAAAHLYDPVLALTVSDQIPSGNPLRIQAARPRSAAYIVLADYRRAVLELDAVEDDVRAGLSTEERVSWVAAMVNALLWVPEGRTRIPELLDACRTELDSSADMPGTPMNSRKTLDLASFQYQVHYGDFAEAAPGLEAGLLDEEDREYRLNCASMLVTVWAACGREQEAVQLARSISAEVQQFDPRLISPDLHYLGMIYALLWSGQWHDCIGVLDDLLANLPQASQYGGGALELALGMAYTYAGRGQEAIEVLLAAAAQLEVRDSYNSTNLAYSALAFSHAQVGDVGNVEKYLALADQTDSCTTWVGKSIAKFFRLMALRWIDDPAASGLLIESAKADMAKKRFTAASISLFGATVHGSDQEFALLEEASLRRQGPMASLNAVLARACRSRSAAKALEAAVIAEELDLVAVESRCAVLALEFAHDAGDNRRSREAQQRLDRLAASVPVLPMTPRSAGVKLTQRELQVAKLAGRGLGNRAIADRIGVSVRTVEGHLYQVFAKFGITSRIELDQVKGL